MFRADCADRLLEEGYEGKKAPRRGPHAGQRPRLTDEIRCHLSRLEREQTEREAENRETDEDEFHYESPARAAERVRQFASIKDLLTADTLGTS
jgi:hypothetical protein